MNSTNLAWTKMGNTCLNFLSHREFPHISRGPQMKNFVDNLNGNVHVPSLSTWKSHFTRSFSPLLSWHACFSEFLSLTPQKCEGPSRKKKIRAAYACQQGGCWPILGTCWPLVPGRRLCTQTNETLPHHRTLNNMKNDLLKDSIIQAFALLLVCPRREARARPFDRFVLRGPHARNPNGLSWRTHP